MDVCAKRFNMSRLSDEDRRYVEQIMLDVKSRGDEALLDYTARQKPFDNVRLSKEMLMVSDEEFRQAETKTSKEVERAILFAMKKVEKVVKIQMRAFSPVHFKEDGLEYVLRSYPLERIGLLVPGGAASYVSTLVMAAYPAILVGVREINVLTPPRSDGSVNPVILRAARLMGLSRAYRCNMVAGVGALTFGTETIPRVDKIFGPGSKFVTLAKMVASSYGVPIDIPAGPSELVVLADHNADPKLVALDLAAQAEHSQDTFIVLITNSERLADTVNKILMEFSENHGLRIEMGLHLVNTIEEGAEKCNLLAPEHVSLHVKNPKRLAQKISAAGTVFLGGSSPPAVGDYASGSIHVLPTGGYARVRGGLTIFDYLRLVSYQGFSVRYLRSVYNHVKMLSSMEGLPLHGVSVEARLRDKMFL